MFNLNCKNLINPEMSKYIKEQLIRKYDSNRNSYNSYLVKYDYTKQSPNMYILLPFVSLISFLAGYNFRNLISTLKTKY